MLHVKASDIVLLLAYVLVLDVDTAIANYSWDLTFPQMTTKI